MRSKILTAGLLVTVMSLFSCGSNVESSGSGADVPYNPSTSSQYEAVGYGVILNRLQVDFALPSNASSVQQLNTDKVYFSVTNLTYDPIYAIKFDTIMAKACHDMDTNTLFSDGVKIDKAWVALTGRPVSEAAAVQSATLAAIGTQSDDVKIYSLCMAAALNAGAIFDNYL